MTMTNRPREGHPTAAIGARHRLFPLRDGRVVRLRPIRPEDAPALVELHDRLSPPSRYFRYFSPKPRLSLAEAAYFADVDGVERFGVVATAIEGPQERVVGVGSLFLDGAERAELALLVRDDYQGVGLGVRLGEELAETAADHHVRYLTATILADNLPMLRLATSRGGRLQARHPAEVIYELDLLGGGDETRSTGTRSDIGTQLRARSGKHGHLCGPSPSTQTPPPEPTASRRLGGAGADETTGVHEGIRPTTTAGDGPKWPRQRRARPFPAENPHPRRGARDRVAWSDPADGPGADRRPAQGIAVFMM